MDKAAFETAECIRANYLNTHPTPEDDIMECICLSELAQEIADECVPSDLIYQ